MSGDTIVLIDRSPTDPDEAAAVTYMLRRLDAQIQEEADEWRQGAPSASLESQTATRLNCALDRIFDRASVFVMSGTSFRGRSCETLSVEAVPTVARARM